VKPARLMKKLGAALAGGLLALGMIAGTASAASAAEQTTTATTATYAPASSGELQ
jgi:hypothetical protein